eukprot:7653636-Pyramimonas_sp.AAC.1
MMIQQSVGWRLRRLGYRHITEHKDISNAFGSSSRQAILEANQSIMKDGEGRFGAQRLHLSTVCFVGTDGIFFAKPTVGALQGDPWAVKVFIRDIGTVFQRAQEDFQESGELTAKWCT